MSDYLSASMLDVLLASAARPITAEDAGSTGSTMAALCNRGLLTADKSGKPTIYTITARGNAIVAIINTPVEARPGEGALARIQRVTAHHYRLPVAEMWSANRDREVARPRQVAMYLSRELTPLSLPNIGRRFGKRDHSTVIHAIKTIQHLCRNDAKIAADVNRIRGEFQMVQP